MYNDSMATLQIREMPEDVYARLKHSAERERRSINQHALYLLEHALAVADSGQERRRMLFERIRQRPPYHWPEGMSPEQLTREDRAR